MNCQQLLLQIQDKTAECQIKREDADDCDAELASMYMMYWYYCSGA